MFQLLRCETRVSGTSTLNTVTHSGSDIKLAGRTQVFPLTDSLQATRHCVEVAGKATKGAVPVLAALAVSLHIRLLR